MAKDHWISMEEAIEGVMRHKKCSRRTARRLLASHMKDGKVGYRNVPVKLQLLDLETTARLTAEDPENLFVPLSELIRAYRFTGDELLGELRAGRLVAAAINESVAVTMEMKNMEMENSFHWSDFVVTSVQLADWIANPATSSDLRDKFYRRLQ